MRLRSSCGPPALREDELRRSRLPQCRQDCRSGFGERVSVLPARLHALGWDRPCPGSEIDLRPLRTDGRAGAGSGQDGEFKSPGSDALLLPKLDHEPADVAIVERGEMRGCALA